MKEIAAPLPDVFRRLEGEISRIEEMARRVEDVVADLLSEQDKETKSARVALQEIDLLIQSSGDIKLFLACLGSSTESLPLLSLTSALCRVRLDRVRSSLAGASDSHPAIAGEASFF
jgi:hypothetical protein